jgi:hypothetical protein
MDSMKRSIAVVGVLFLVSLVLIWTPSKAVSMDLGEARLIYDDGAVRVFAVPKPEGFVESSGQAEVGPTAALPKMKLMTCHVTNPPLEAWDSYPWIAIGESMAHFTQFELLKASDMINIVFTVKGPQFSTPYVYKTNWVGPADPAHYYYVQWIPGTVGDGTDFYTTEGYYQLTVKGIPKLNKLNGTSTCNSWFHILPAAPPPAP